MEMTSELKRAIKIKLLASGVNEADFAERVGISASHFYQVLGGKRTCSRVTMLRMMDILGRIGAPAPELPEGVTPNVRAL